MDSLDDAISIAVDLNGFTLKMQGIDHLVDNILEAFPEEWVEDYQKIIIQNSIVEAYHLGLKSGNHDA